MKLIFVTQGRHIGAPINQRADPLASQGVNNPRVLSLMIRTVDMVNQYIHKRSVVMLKQKINIIIQDITVFKIIRNA